LAIDFIGLLLNEFSPELFDFVSHKLFFKLIFEIFFQV